jgi:putative ABC transport system ATP-binding protein
MSPRLELRNVTRIHGEGHTEVVSLSDVSLTLVPGELLSVMGPSGSGKSTLLALAGGIDRPTSGTVLIDGTDLATLTVAQRAALRRHGIGYVFQQYNLIDGLTAAENVALPLELDGVGRRAATAAAIAALETVGLAGFADRFPSQLSGGEQQRIAIARAVVGARTLLLADEPTGALDSVTGEQTLRLLRSHCDDGGSAVLATHDARFAAWADRILFLEDGLLVDGTSGSGIAALGEVTP